MYELTNEQRVYFGLDSIGEHWERVLFKADKYRPESILYYDGDTIKRHISSTADTYSEKQFDELTRGREVLLPKTGKGKEKKLSPSVLESRQAEGVYLSIHDGYIRIGNFDTQSTFYHSYWESFKGTTQTVPEMIDSFIRQSPEDHMEKIDAFKKATRKLVKYKMGDYFSFKLDRVYYGFGRLLIDVHKLRKEDKLPDGHGLGFMMGHALVIQLFAYKSTSKHVDIALLDRQPKLPADVMMDNKVLHGDYEIIGHRALVEEELEFPISYGGHISGGRRVFLQWGMIHLELPEERFNKYLGGPMDHNPYGFYSVGFEPHYNAIAVRDAVKNGGVMDYETYGHYMAKQDLRNPKNKQIRDEVLLAFGLDPEKTYAENARLTGTVRVADL